MTTNFSIEKLPILTAGGGTEINLCIHHYHAAATGKKVYIQAGLHGGETAQWSLKLLHDFLLNNLQSGEVCIIPYANPLGCCSEPIMPLPASFPPLTDGISTAFFRAKPMAKCRKGFAPH